MYGTIVFLSEGSSFGLLSNVVVSGVDECPQCRGGGGAGDRALIIKVWVHLILVIAIDWS